jgi:hypothetical protein
MTLSLPPFITITAQSHSPTTMSTVVQNSFLEKHKTILDKHQQSFNTFQREFQRLSAEHQQLIQEHQQLIQEHQRLLSGPGLEECQQKVVVYQTELLFAINNSLVC